jgi:hypothetical protein
MVRYHPVLHAIARQFIKRRKASHVRIDTL